MKVCVVPGTAQCRMPCLHCHHCNIISHLAPVLVFPLLPLLPFQAILLPGLEQSLKITPHWGRWVLLTNSSSTPVAVLWTLCGQLLPPFLCPLPTPVPFSCPYRAPS